MLGSCSRPPVFQGHTLNSFCHNWVVHTGIQGLGSRRTARLHHIWCRRDKELAKFEAFLNKEECMNINALIRGRSRMAYPVKQ